MRWIRVPRPIAVGAGKVSFLELVEQVWLADPLFGQSVANLRAALRIGKAFEEYREALVVLDEADWSLLCQVAQAPRVGYNPAVMRHALPLIDALLEAPDQRPADSPP